MDSLKKFTSAANGHESITKSLYPRVHFKSIKEKIPIKEVAAHGIAFADRIVTDGQYIDNESAIYLFKKIPYDILKHLSGITGIISTNEDKSSHLAIVCRSKGIPVINVFEESYIKLTDEEISTCHEERFFINTFDKSITIGTTEIDETNVIENRKHVFELAEANLDFSIHANADTVDDIENAVKHGFKRSWPRSETLLYNQETLNYFRALLIDPKIHIAERFSELHGFSIQSLFKSTQGTRLSFRLFDPPAHEFLPSIDDDHSINNLAEILEDSKDIIREKIRKLQEINPMVGHRGARLLLTNSLLLEAQINGLFNAWENVSSSEKPPEIEILVPFVMHPQELRSIRNFVDALAKTHSCKNLPVKFGCMIEVPSILSYPQDIANLVDFVSYGTNDLSALTYAISRGDSYDRYLNTYLDLRYLDQDPFFELSNFLISQISEFSEKLRAANPKVEIDICGEQVLGNNIWPLLENKSVDSVSIGVESLPVFILNMIERGKL